VVVVTNGDCGPKR